jgi:hypothetical protein
MPLARMLLRVIGSPAGDRGFVLMPRRIPRRPGGRKAARPDRKADEAQRDFVLRFAGEAAMPSQ